MAQRRHVLAIAGVLVAGCHRMEVEVTSPGGDLIKHHDPIELVVATYGDQPRGFLLELDTIAVQDEPTITPDPRTHDCDECVFTLTWDGREATEGLHSLAVIALDGDDQAIGIGGVDLTFDDMPEITGDLPSSDDLIGVGRARVGASVIERGSVTAQIEIDGEPAGQVEADDCRYGCEPTWLWHTETLPAGPHTVRTILTDGHGRRSESTRTVDLGDIFHVSSIEVTNEYDSGSFLDIEVHLFDAATSEFLGCAGEDQGLEQVDANDIAYNIDAILVTATGDYVNPDTFTGSVQLEVWEDDVSPCTSPANSNIGDDFLGRSQPMTLAEWRAQTEPLAFGLVPGIQVELGRPLER